MTSIEITIKPYQHLAQQDAWLLMPQPVDDFERMFDCYDIQGVSRFMEINAINSPQKAYLAKTIQGVDEIRISYGFKSAHTPPSDDFWLQQNNRLYHRISGA